MIEIKNVSVSFGDKKIIDNLCISLPDTGLVTFSGASGSGKTTLLRTLLGLQNYSGEIIKDRKLTFSAVFQESSLLPWLTAAENVAAVCEINDNNLEKAKELLSQVGFDEIDFDKLPYELSVGMARRVAAARAVMIDFDVLVLDEPFAGLDEDNISAVADLLLSQRNEKLIILVTHVGDFSADFDYKIGNND
ncbi:MAG: ATP-binding cassette domain-containing protein [Clostridia bacterium]|nr:ATP-binding cassette domain-containing protein [Clostridia bacterium]